MSHMLEGETWLILKCKILKKSFTYSLYYTRSFVPSLQGRVIGRLYQILTSKTAAWNKVYVILL